MILHQFDGLFGDDGPVDQRFGLLFQQNLPGLADGYLPGLVSLGHDLLEHVLQVDVHRLHAHVRENLNGNRPLFDGQFDHLVLELAGFQLGLHLVAGALPAFAFFGIVLGFPVLGGRHEQVEQLFHDALARLGLDLLALLLLDEADGRFGQVADHALDVAADVADFGILGRFDLNQRSADELGKLAGDLGLAHAGRADHDDVLRRDRLAQIFRQLLAPPAIADRHGDGFLGRVLPDDVAIQLGDDFSRRQVH